MTRVGTVTRVLPEADYGFLRDDDGSTVFFHRSGCAAFDALHEGDVVQFTPVPTVKGPRAADVRLTTPSTPMTDDATARHLPGFVVRLVEVRGFGFIRASDGTEYFFHRSACPEYDTLHRGSPVTFVAVATAKGARAEDVRAL